MMRKEKKTICRRRYILHRRYRLSAATRRRRKWCAFSVIGRRRARLIAGRLCTWTSIQSGNTVRSRIARQSSARYEYYRSTSSSKYYECERCTNACCHVDVFSVSCFCSSSTTHNLSNAASTYPSLASRPIHPSVNLSFRLPSLSTSSLSHLDFITNYVCSLLQSIESM